MDTPTLLGIDSTTGQTGSSPESQQYVKSSREIMDALIKMNTEEFDKFVPINELDFSEEPPMARTESQNS